MLIRGVKAGARRSLAVRPRAGRLTALDARRGTVRYTPRAVGRTTTNWATYELWNATTTLSTDTRTLAGYATGFGVFNPSRYADGTSIRRTVDPCSEVEPNGDRANTAWCGSGVVGFDDPRSAFEGTQRDTYLGGTTVGNAGGPRLWWTDPYGGHAQTTPFPGGICQLVSSVDTPDRADVQTQVFGRNRSNHAPGVHAPNQ